MEHDEQITVSGNRWECAHCQTENRPDYRFCAACGKPRFTFDAEFGKKSVYSVMALYFLLLLAIIFLYWAEPGGSGWEGEMWGGLSLAAITVIFVCLGLRDFVRYIFPSRLRWEILALAVLGAPLFSFAVTNVVNRVNRSWFGGVDTGLMHRYADAPNPLLYAVVFTAVFPALFEELAFRGVVFSRGRGVFSLKQTIWVSSILFTFLHLSVLSFLWLMPFALVLGWLRARYRTVFYGMVIHFLHNFTAVLLEYYHYDQFL